MTCLAQLNQPNDKESAWNPVAVVVKRILRADWYPLYLSTYENDKA